MWLPISMRKAAGGRSGVQQTLRKASAHKKHTQTHTPLTLETNKPTSVGTLVGKTLTADFNNGKTVCVSMFPCQVGARFIIPSHLLLISFPILILHRAEKGNVTRNTTRLGARSRVLLRLRPSVEAGELAEDVCHGV